MDLDRAKGIFIDESRELLEEMEGALLALEENPGDEDLLNRIFRAAHTIKGSGGMFGFDEIVSFTHVMETLLDNVRNGEVEVTEVLIALLLRARDHLSGMVEALAAGEPLSGDESEELKAQLNVLCVTDEGRGESISAGTEPSTDSASDETMPHHISVRFGKDTFRQGMDPIALIQTLGNIGTLKSVQCLTESIPCLNSGEFDPESCYLGFEIDLLTTADKGEIAEIFDFVREESILHILPPPTKIEEYARLIKELPEDDMIIGQYLVRSGAVTAEELRDALEAQKKEGGLTGKILVEQGAVQKDVVNAALEKQKQVRTIKAQEAASVRVNAAKLESLINLVGELVISGANIFQLSQDSGSGTLVESASGMYRLIEELRETALGLRMVPIGDTFNRFNRLVRDISKDIGKEISLVINGGETELDKTVVEKINDPLVHLVRNAVDHGIEMPDVRTENGKPARGTVTLNAYHDAGNIAIEVSDDGGGLARERILEKARERGLISANQNLSDREVFQLVFEPGFSTAEAVSDLSGRGVGMDVVKRNIEALRGSVEIDSNVGKGTTVNIRLPLTLAIISGFLVGVGGSAYVIPLDMVVECVELTREDRENSHGRDYINLRGEVLPFIYLKMLFERGDGSSVRENIVVVQYGGMRAGLVVDELMGEIQTVIKPLGKIFHGLPGVSGATILGSGDVALILDVPGLVRLAIGREADVYSKGSGSEEAITSRHMPN